MSKLVLYSFNQPLEHTHSLCMFSVKSTCAMDGLALNRVTSSLSQSEEQAPSKGGSQPALLQRRRAVPDVPAGHGIYNMVEM